MNAAETEARIQLLLAGEPGTPVPGSDFDIVLDALRNARIDVGTLEHLLDSANAELARVNADFDLTASCAARVVVERDALKARLDAIAAAHTPPPGRTHVDVHRDGRALALDLAPHVKVADVAKDIDRALRDAAEEDVSVVDALRAYDLASKTGVPLMAHAHALRVAARAAGIRTDDFFNADRSDWPGLIAACRAAPDAGRSEASDGFGLGSVGGAA